MIRNGVPARSSAAPLLLAAALPALVLAPLIVVLARVGVSGPVLAGLVAGMALVVTLTVGASGGTMRLPTYLTGGRHLGGFGLGLAQGALVLAVVPAGQALPAGLALALAILVGAPAVSRAGAVSVPTFLAARYGGRSLRLLSALLVAGAGLVLGGAQLSRAALALAGALPVGPGLSLGLCALVPLVVLVPAGTRGLVRAAVAAGCLALLAAAAVVSLRLAPPVSETLPPLRALAEGSPAGLAALCAVILALPFHAPLATAADRPSSTREAAAWAALLVVLSGTATLVPAAPASVFPAIPAAALAVLAPLATATALLAAAGVALGYDLPGERDRVRVSTSRRFALVRLAMSVSCLAAAAIAARSGAGLAQQGPGLAEAALVAGVLPPVLLTLVRPCAGGGAGATALLLGLAGAALAYDPRVWPGGNAPVGFALAGCLAGVVGGWLVSWVAPPARPLPIRDESAL